MSQVPAEIALRFSSFDEKTVGKRLTNDQAVQLFNSMHNAIITGEAKFYHKNFEYSSTRQKRGDPIDAVTIISPWIKRPNADFILESYRGKAGQPADKLNSEETDEEIIDDINVIVIGMIVQVGLEIDKWAGVKTVQTYKDSDKDWAYQIFAKDGRLYRATAKFTNEKGFQFLSDGEFIVHDLGETSFVDESVSPTWTTDNVEAEDEQSE